MQKKKLFLLISYAFVCLIIMWPTPRYAISKFLIAFLWTLHTNLLSKYRNVMSITYFFFTNILIPCDEYIAISRLIAVFLSTYEIFVNENWKWYDFITFGVGVCAARINVFLVRSHRGVRVSFDANNMPTFMCQKVLCIWWVFGWWCLDVEQTNL